MQPINIKMHEQPCVLTIAGSDSGGGAGIQADLKTITVLGGYGLSVITALTAQNTRGVFGIHAPEASFVDLQLSSVLDDFPIAAAKTGMLFSSAIIQSVADRLKDRSFPLVVDPVCVSQSGHRLLEEEALASLREVMIPMADLLTPNRPEAEVLTGFAISGPVEAAKATERLLAMGAKAVLLKGGHFEGDRMIDWLARPGSSIEAIERPRINTPHTHGTGCTLSAAVATGLGKGLSLHQAVDQAREYLQLALQSGYPLGQGQGPVNHLAWAAKEQGRIAVLETLHRVGEELLTLPGLGRLVPEVRMNFALALPFASSQKEVAAFEGRISAGMDGRVRLNGCPRFGASSHMARVVLAAQQVNPTVHCAVNLRSNDQVFQAMEQAGLVTVSFDRSEESADVKAREGGTLEWGTLKALGRAKDQRKVDAIADPGESGKEPMIRLLGRDADDVLNKMLMILKHHERI